MAQRDGRVDALAGKEGGDGLADDVRTADHDGVLAREIHSGDLDEFDDPVRGAGEEAVVADKHLADVDRREAVDVLVLRDGIDDPLLAESLRQGELHEDAVDQRIGVELADLGGASPEDYFFLRIKGDSMKNIGMVDGALVLFRKQQYAQDGQIVACLVGGESATVKRFSKKGRRMRLLPENESYSPIELTPADFETGEARILGVAEEIKIKL